MEKYEFNKFVLEYKNKLDDLYVAFDIKNKDLEYKELDQKINDPNFWSNQELAQNVISRFNIIKDIINEYRSLEKSYNSIIENAELAFSDFELLAILDDDVSSFKDRMKITEEKALLNGKYDMSNCILELHPGAGGVESMDWALMLYRMYTRYCDKKKFKVTVLDYIPGSEAGIKSVSIEIKGPFAYGRLKSERGVHRLVRISPFDSNASRHTSFCSCDISPIVDDDNEIKINDEDIRIDVFHSSGAGGQSVNTTDSAVRITHLKTGIVVTCQNERSQLKNKEYALNVLKSKLMNLKIKEAEDELRKEKGSQMKIDFGSQIRSYVFTPYTLVKDHRTEYSETNVDSVMDGNIDNFIDEYLKYLKGK